jgi:hypothetical protein
MSSFYCKYCGTAHPIPDTAGEVAKIDKIEEVKLKEYYQKWELSGANTQNLVIKEIITKIEDKLNEIIKFINKV